MVAITAQMTTAASATAATVTVAMTTAAQARALAGQKAEPDQIVTRQIAVPKVAARALVRPADLQCGVRVAMMTTTMMMTVALRKPAGPAWVPEVQAGCPALAARRSLVVERAELDADLKPPDGCRASADQPLVACPECRDLAAFPAVGPVLAAAQATSMIALPRWSADLRPSNGRCARIATKGVPREIAVPKRAVRKAAARKVGAVQKHDQKA